MSSAFICDRDTFNHIFKLEKRRAGREVNSSYLSEIEIEGNKLNANNLKTASQRLRDILVSKVRSGDTICCWKENLYLVLLYNIDRQNTAKVLDRVSKCYFNEGKTIDTDLEIYYRSLKNVQEVIKRPGTKDKD